MPQNPFNSDAFVSASQPSNVSSNNATGTNERQLIASLPAEVSMPLNAPINVREKAEQHLTDEQRRQLQNARKRDASLDADFERSLQTRPRRLVTPAWQQFAKRAQPATLMRTMV